MLQDLSCSFARGQLTALLGGNGSGKTTTLSLLAGLRRPLRGKRFCRTERIGLLPQDPQMLFDRATVRDELREQLASLPEAEQARRMQEMACFCRLEGLLDRHPYDLSGGEQQRAALAKLLLAGPELLLLDEPTKGMDAQVKRELAAILNGLLEQGATVVMVSHDVEFCAAVCRPLSSDVRRAPSQPRAARRTSLPETTSIRRPRTAWPAACCRRP